MLLVLIDDIYDVYNSKMSTSEGIIFVNADWGSNINSDDRSFSKILHKCSMFKLKFQKSNLLEMKIFIAKCFLLYDSVKKNNRMLFKKNQKLEKCYK